MELLDAMRDFDAYAKRRGMRYGDSHSAVPCEDNVTSCDRAIFRALWNMSPNFRDQRVGGETVLTMERYLRGKGFARIARPADLRAGDIVLMQALGTKAPTAAWHNFILTDYDPKTQICSKYDYGSQSRIHSAQPFRRVPLNEWVGSKVFYCAFRFPEPKVEKYRFSPSSVFLGSRGLSVLLCQEILKARGFKGKDGKALTLDKECGTNTVHAIASYQRARQKQGVTLDEAGVCGMKTWIDLLGM